VRCAHQAMPAKTKKAQHYANDHINRAIA